MGEPATESARQASSRRQWIALGIMCLLFAAIFLGLWGMLAGGFVPSKLGEAFFGVSAATGVAVGVALALRMPEERITRKWMKDPALRSIGMALGAAMFFSTASQGIGWTSAALFGTRVDQVVTVSGWRYGGKVSCEGPELVEAPVIASLCLGDGWREKLPPGTRLIVSGRETPLGMDVDSERLPPKA